MPPKNHETSSCLQINTCNCLSDLCFSSQLTPENKYDVICVQEPFASLSPGNRQSLSSPGVSNIPPGYKCFQNLSSNHAYGALIFARSVLKAQLCPKYSSNNISAIEFKSNSVSLFVISAYLRPTIKNPDETLYTLYNLLENVLKTTKT